MKTFDAQDYYTDHYSGASAQDWVQWHQDGTWPPPERRRPAGEFSIEDGHGVVYHLLQAEAPFERTLDIGCSAGDLILPIRAMSKECHGVDIVRFEGAWHVLKEHYGIHCQTHDFDKSDLPFPDGHFSAVTMIMVLEHVFNVEHAVSEISRVLRPGGVAVVQVPNIAYLKHRISLLLGRLPITSNTDNQEFIDSWDGQHLHNYTLDSLKMVFSRHDLHIEKCRCFGRLSRWRSLWPSLLGGDLTVLARKRKSA